MERRVIDGYHEEILARLDCCFRLNLRSFEFGPFGE